MRWPVRSNRVCAPLIVREVGWRLLVVENPDSLWKKTVLESGGLGLDTVGYSARWQKDIEFMGEVGVVRYHTGCYTETAFVKDVFHWRQRDSSDVLCCLHYLLQGHAVWYSAVPKAESDAAGQGTLNDASVEYAEDGEGESNSSLSVQEVEILLGFFCAFWETCSLSPFPQGCHG